MPTLSVSVMAHVDRSDQAMALSAKLGDCDIAWDSLLLDYGEVANGDRAWAMHDPDADWHIVLQDDAVPVDGFLEHAQAALDWAGDGPVSFYVGTGRPQQIAVGIAMAKADRVRAAWLQSTALYWGVAVAMPTPMVRAFLDWGAERRLGHYDKRITHFAQHLSSPVAYTLPSLVDHADGPSLLTHPWGEPKQERRAWRVGVPARWDTTTVVIR